MYGYPFQIITAVFQKVNIPLKVCQSRCAKLRLWIYPHHHLCRFSDQMPPFLRGFGSQLPGPVILIANAPVFYFIGLYTAVFNSPSGIFPLALQIAVFHPVAHFLRRTGPCICTDIRFASYLSAEFYVLVRTEGIRVLYSPRLVKHGCSLGTHSFLPMVRRHKTSSGPPQYRHLDLFHCFQDISAESVFIRQRRIRFIDPSVNLSVEMLNEMSVDHFIPLSHDPFLIDMYFHLSPPLHKHIIKSSLDKIHGKFY